MAVWGSVDYHEVENFQRKLNNFLTREKDKFFSDCAAELAARLLQKVIPRTPVGDYSNLMPGYERNTAGTLRRNWTGGKVSAPEAYARTLPITKRGLSYVITVKNPTRYASYVEYGHTQTPGRYVPAIGKSLKRGWVDGQFFLTISENEIRGIAPDLLAKKLENKLREVLDD